MWAHISSTQLHDRINWRDFFARLRVVLIISAILLGNLFGLKQLTVLGVVPTYYRVVTIFMTVYFLVNRFILKKAEKGFSKLFIITFALMAFWIVYASIQLFVIPGLDKREGLKEIMALVLGMSSIYCLYEVIVSKEIFKFLVKTARIIIAVLILLALFEITSGIHLPTSRYCDPEYLQSAGYVARYGSRPIVWHTTTGVFYNQNDFLFMLALASSFFYPDTSDRIREKVLCYIGLSMVLMVSVMNGGFITTVAILAGMLMFLILTKASIKKHIVVWGGAFLIQSYIAGWFNKLLMVIYDLFKGGNAQGSTEMIADVQSLEKAVRMQVGNASANQGSLYYRITLYIDSIKAFLNTYGLGLGPKGFNRYFTLHPSESGLTNPHNWYFEILVQYGVFVFLFFAICYVMAVIKAIKAFLKTRYWGLAIAVSMAVIFVPGCFAPSSMLGLSYIWLPLSLCIALQNVSVTDKAYEKSE